MRGSDSTWKPAATWKSLPAQGRAALDTPSSQGGRCPALPPSLPADLPAQLGKQERELAAGQEQGWRQASHTSALPQKTRGRSGVSQAAPPAPAMQASRDGGSQLGRIITSPSLPSWRLPLQNHVSSEQTLLLAPAPSPFFLHCSALEQKVSERDKHMKKQDFSLEKPKLTRGFQKSFPGKMAV